MSHHKVNVFLSLFKAAHICQVSPERPAAARRVPTDNTALPPAPVSGFGSTTKSGGQMDLLAPLHPIPLAQQKAAPYSGAGSQGGRRIEFCCRYVGEQADRSAEMQRVPVSNTLLQPFKMTIQVAAQASDH